MSFEPKSPSQEALDAVSKTMDAFMGVSVQMRAMYVKDVSFENPHMLRFLAKPTDTPPHLDVGYSIDAQGIGNNHFEVTLNVRVIAREEEPSERTSEADDTLFLVEIAYAGIFEIQTEDAEVLKVMLLTEAPRQLFPFARALVATITKDSALPPVILAPVDFTELYAQSQQRQDGLPN